MNPDYTNYKHQLEQYGAVLDQRISALAAFVAAVDLDWETVRTTKALSQLFEIKTRVDVYLKKLAQDAAAPKVDPYSPATLSTFLTLGTTIAKVAFEDPGLLPGTSDERLISAFLQNPRNASLLLGVLDKVLKEIQTTRIPVGKNATAYVDQRLREELGEALRKPDSSPNRPNYFTPA